MINLFLSTLLTIGFLHGNIEKQYQQDTTYRFYLLLDESNSLYKFREKVLTIANIILTYPDSKCEKILKFGNKKLHEVLITGQDQKIHDIKKKNYKPYGNSPLYDAITETVKDIEDSKKTIDSLIIISDFNDQGSKSNKQEVENLLNTCDFDVIKVKVGETND